jgi:transposase InsO family protein
MDKLSETQRADIKKMSTVRLTSKLMTAGMADEEIESLDRPGLIEAWARMIVAGKDKPAAMAVPITMGYDPSVEREKLAFEKLKFEAEQEERVRRDELEAIRLQEERAHKLECEERERVDRVRQLEQMEIQIELRRREIILQEMKASREEKAQDTAVARLKRFGDAMKNAMTRMPNDPMELISFFDCLEQLFTTLAVDNDLKVTLLRPYLNDRARNLLFRYDPSSTANYEKVKQYLLQEFHLSPQVYLEKFNTAIRANEDTYVLFCGRLKSLLEYYMKSRKIIVSNDPSYLRVLSLLICDRIKSSLPEHVLKHILTIESSCKDGWLSHTDLAEAIDLYMANHLYDGKPKGGAIGVQAKSYSKAYNAPYQSSVPQTGKQKSGVGNHVVQNNSNATIRPRLCHHCSSPSHLVANCPSKQTSATTQGYRQNGQAQNNHARPSQSVRINTARAVESETQAAINQPEPVIQTVNEVLTYDVDTHDMYDDFVNTLYGKISVIDNLSENGTQTEHVMNTNVCNTEIVVSNNDELPNIAVEFAELHRIEVFIQGVEHSVKCLEDSGAQIGIVRADVISNMNLKRVGTVKLRGIFGSPIDADLIKLYVKLSDNVDEMYTPVIVAVCEGVYEQMILPHDIVNRLLESRDSVCVITTSVDIDLSTNESIEANSISDSTLIPVDTEKDDELLLRRANAETLRSEQVSDESLTHCWTLARNNKGDYFIHDGLLYHRDNVVGQAVSQLCLPARRRAEVLKLAHDIHGGHLSFRKSRDRVRLSFHWPTLKPDLLRHIQCCVKCQTRARVTYRDRVPITPIPRAQTAFTHWVMDCFGPIMGSQKIEYPYCLLLCDSATRFPWAYPLRNLTAKGVCDALLQLFSFTGVASQCVISSDQGANFTAQLTREFMKRLGVSPRFNTPGHPQASGLCERLVQSTKRIIGKLAQDSPRSWHKYLNSTMWALREVPNETTGVSPFQAVFGILPKGPLAILKEHWCGETDLPLNLSKGTAEYLEDLRRKLEIAQSSVDSHTKLAQKRYAHYHNLRSRDKHFTVGEQVIILMPDSTSSKAFSRWRGPAVIVEKRSPYSYLVEIDGARQHMHANHLRKFYAQVEEILCDQISLLNDCDDESDIVNVNSSSCAIVYDNDIAFGALHVVEPSVVQIEKVNELLPSQKIDSYVLSHLSNDQKTEFLALLDKFPECFSDTPGCNNTVQHKITVTPEFKPKRLKPYRIPEALKGEVSKQIEQLLELGFVQPSRSEMASPIVCVMKGKEVKDGVRIAIDYRWVNKYSLGDAHPLSDPSDVLQKIGHAKYISTFDTKAGYHQTVVEPSSRWLTAFVSGDQLLEWTRTPFGLKGAGYTFVRMLQRVLQPVSEFTASFIDDISVFSSEWPIHIKQVERFLQIIKDAGLTLNLKKSRFAQSEVKFVGHLVGSGKRRADPSKLETVREMKVPETKRQVRQIIGFFSFFRDYIPKFADHAKVLTDLTAKRAPNLVQWTPIHQEAFQTLKDLLCRATVEPLYVIDFSQPFNIFVDASDYAVAGFLSQTFVDGSERPIAFASNKLSRTQQNWSTVEREAFAAIWVLQKFRQWIFGSNVTLFSDHNPLTFLTECAPKSSKLMRWSLALQEFNVSFKYKPGRENLAADCLSRIGTEEWDRPQNQSIAE